MRWWWRIHSTLPDIDKGDVFYIACAFAFREIEFDMLNREFNVGDIEALITFRPWIDETHEKAYYQGVQDGFIPGVAPTPLVRIANLGRDRQKATAYGTLLVDSHVWPDPDRPHLLPSQLFES